MQEITVYTLQALELQLKACAKNNKQWFVFRYNGFAFKCFGKWAQIMQSPGGLRASGVMGHKTQKGFVAEILNFINQGV
jgi:hypothetical protein